MSSLPVSIKKSLPSVCSRTAGTRAALQSLGALLRMRECLFMICCGFYLKGGNDTTKEMWKVFEDTRATSHSKNKADWNNFRVKLLEVSRISSA